MQLKEGWLYWGSPFDPDEVVAFTSLQEGQTSDQASIYPPTHLCYFAWVGGPWKQRQYLGHGKELDMHTRNGGKEHYLQALSIKGKYEADQHSWRYDPKTRKLEPTGLDGWGRYWIAGDYVCYPRRWERLAHDSAVWVYQFQDGKKGDLIASLQEVDDGSFKVEFRESGQSRLQRWAFRPLDNNDKSVADLQLEVRIAFGEKESDEPDAELVLEEPNTLNEYAFALLTGLNTDLLKRKWMDVVPKPKVLDRLPMKVTGNAVVMKRFAWQTPEQEKAKFATAERTKQKAIENMALQAVAEIVPVSTRKTAVQVAHPNGVLSLIEPLFEGEGTSAVALVPNQQPHSMNVDVVLLQGTQTWKVQQNAGPAFPGTPRVRRTNKPAGIYLTIEPDDGRTRAPRLWRCDSATQKLVPIDCQGATAVSISGDVVTLRGPSYSRGTTFLRISTEGTRPLATLEGGNITISRPDGQTELWRLGEVSGGTGTGKALYTLWKAEDASTRGRDVARIETEWHNDRQAFIMKRLAMKLIGLTARQYYGVWDDGPKDNLSDAVPIPLIVRGSDSLVELLQTTPPVGGP